MATEDLSFDNWHVAVSVFLPPTGEKLDEWAGQRRALAIERIVQAVGEPADDRDQLANHIFEVCVDMRCQVDPLEGKKANDQLEKVQRILKAINKCATLIESNEYLRNVIKRSRGLMPRPFTQTLLELKSLEQSLSQIAKTWREKTDLPP